MKITWLNLKLRPAWVRHICVDLRHHSVLGYICLRVRQIHCHYRMKRTCEQSSDGSSLYWLVTCIYFSDHGCLPQFFTCFPLKSCRRIILSKWPSSSLLYSRCHSYTRLVDMAPSMEKASVCCHCRCWCTVYWVTSRGYTTHPLLHSSCRGRWKDESYYKFLKNNLETLQFIR